MTIPITTKNIKAPNKLSGAQDTNRMKRWKIHHRLFYSMTVGIAVLQYIIGAYGIIISSTATPGVSYMPFQPPTFAFIPIDSKVQVFVAYAVELVLGFILLRGLLWDIRVNRVKTYMEAKLAWMWIVKIMDMMSTDSDSLFSNWALCHIIMLAVVTVFYKIHSIEVDKEKFYQQRHQNY